MGRLLGSLLAKVWVASLWWWTNERAVITTWVQGAKGYRRN